MFIGFFRVFKTIFARQKNAHFDKVTGSKTGSRGVKQGVKIGKKN